MDQLIDGEARAGAGREDARVGAEQLREAPVEVPDDDAPPVTDASRAQRRRRHRQPDPVDRRSGARARSTCRWTRSTATSTRTCCSSSTGAGAASRARSGRLRAARTSSRGSSGCGASRTTCTRARCSATSRATRDGNELIVWDPEDFDPATLARARATRLPAPAHARPDLPRGLLPPASRVQRAGRGRAPGGHRRRRGHRADGQARGRRRVRRAAVRPRPRRPDRRGHGRVAALEVRAELGIGAAQGRRYSWGYPACPEQSEHEKVFRLLDAPSIGLRLSGGFAVEPEQSTLAIVAHHPQAVYFGMKSGFLPKTAAGGRRADRRHRSRPDAAVRPERRRPGAHGRGGSGRCLHRVTCAATRPGRRLGSSASHPSRDTQLRS